MATVYITHEVIRRVEAVIESMRFAEHAVELPNMFKTYNTDASRMFNTGCWGEEHVHLIHSIPKTWLPQAGSGTVCIWGSNDYGAGVRTTITFTNLSNAWARPAATHGNKWDSELSIEQVRAFPEETPGRAEALQRWDDAIVELALNQKWEKVRNDIIGFLKKCKSLNEAVKLFPAVRMYISVDDIQRLERKAERTAVRKSIVETIDTTGLTAAAIAAKLAQAA